MIKRPDGMNAYEFSVLAGLRAAQLQRGCTPRVTPSHKVAVTAQREIAERKVVPWVTPVREEPEATGHEDHGSEVPPDKMARSRNGASSVNHDDLSLLIR